MMRNVGMIKFVGDAVQLGFSDNMAVMTRGWCEKLCTGYTRLLWQLKYPDKVVYSATQLLWQLYYADAWLVLKHGNNDTRILLHGCYS